MATIAPSHAPTTAADAGPTAVDAFTADRFAFWASFTGFVKASVIGLVILLILMAIFLV